MISFNPICKLLLPTFFAMTILTACGGGGGSGSTDNGGGFTPSNTNTKPQGSSTSSDSSIASISSTASSISSANQTESSKSSQASSTSSKSSSKSSSSSKAASSTKSTTTGPDVTPPAPPNAFGVVSAFSDVIFLSWAKATDNIGVVAYKLYRDGIQIADLSENENYYADYNVAANKSYSYSVSVGDAAGNWSELTTISATASSTGQTSSRASSTSSKANSSAKSSSSSVASSKASSSSSSVKVTIGVSFQWERPLYRENGNNLFEHEIARYELRYRLPGDTAQTNVIVTSPLLIKTLIDIPSNAAFEIATVDTNGMYSQFVPIYPL